MTNTQRKMDASAPFMAPQARRFRSLYLEALSLSSACIAACSTW